MGIPKGKDPLTNNEGMSLLRGCECSGLNVSNNPLQKIPKGQPEIWCLFGTQIVKTLLDTGAYKSLIKPTVLERIQKDAILVQDDEIHTLRCANKTTNETLGSVKLRFTISDETYEHWFLVFREQSCPAILGLDFLKENRMCIRWDDQQRLELLTQRKWLALNGVERGCVDHGEYQVGVLKAVHCTVIPAGLHTSHECGLVFEEGLLADSYHMDITGEFLNKGIECDIRTREFKAYASSPLVALTLMVDFNSKAL